MEFIASIRLSGDLGPFKNVRNHWAKYSDHKTFALYIASWIMHSENLGDDSIG